MIPIDITLCRVPDPCPNADTAREGHYFSGARQETLSTAKPLREGSIGLPAQYTVNARIEANAGDATRRS